MILSLHSTSSLGPCILNTRSSSQNDYKVHSSYLLSQKGRKIQAGNRFFCMNRNDDQNSCCSSSKPSSSIIPNKAIQNSATLAVSLSVAVLLWSNPARAGFLSGISGLESVPGPELPKVEFLSKFNEENQKKYAADDARIKSSPIMKELLERSKKNKEKNQKEIQDKYCLRGAEWGVGDCSTEGMTPEERDTFIEMLKKKAAENAEKTVE